MKKTCQSLLRFLCGVTLCLAIYGCDDIAGEKTSYDDGISSNALLSNVILSSGELNYAFNSHDWVYEASVPYSVESITISPQAEHAMAVITVNGAMVASGSASEAVELEVGDNVIMIMVTAWDGTENIYTITVVRMENANANLASLIIVDNKNTPANSSDDIKINLKETFNPDTVEYSAVAAGAVSYIGITATAEEGTVAIAKAGTGIDGLNNIEVSTGLNRFLITVTAPDRETKKYYTLSLTKLVGSDTNGKVTGFVIQSVALDPEYDYEDLESPNWADFDFTTDAQIAIGKIESGLAKLVVTTESSAALATITINGESTTVTDLSTDGSLEFPILGSYDSGDFDGFSVDTSYTMNVNIKSGDRTTHNADFTVNIEVTSGNNDATLKGCELFWGSHDSQRVIYPGTFTHDATYHSPTVYAGSTFDSTKTNYVALVYASDSAKIVVEPNDPKVSSITFNGGTGTVEGGKYTYYAALSHGRVTPVEIVVLPENGKTADQRTYTLRIKQLNIYEYYWGVYAAMNRRAFTRWEEEFGSQGVKTVNIAGLISGNLEWKVTLSGLQPRNTMTWTGNYMDGNRDKDGYTMRTDYNDNHPSNNNLHGYMIDGSVSGLLDGVTSKNGTISGSFDLYSPWGDLIGTCNAHYTVKSGKKIEDANSYTDFEYMGETVRMMYRDDNDGNSVNSPYPFSSTYVWDESWDDVNW